MVIKYKPYLNIGPGEFVKEELKIRNWRQEDLSAILGLSLKSINKLIKNKQSITVETAQLFSKAFGQSPQFWLSLDANYRLRLKQDKKREKRVDILANIFKYMPIKEMIKKGWIKKYKDTNELKKQVQLFWGKNSLDFKWLETVQLPNLRKSSAYNQFNLFYAYAWFNMARKCTKSYSADRYSKKRLKTIVTNFAVYTKNRNGIKVFLKDLNKVGVKFFVLHHLSKTYLDGASFCDKRNPVIAYTMRYNRVDNFWFTVAHEIAHILLHLHDRNKYFVDNLELVNTDQEKQANRLALKMIRANQIKKYFKHFDKYISEYRVKDCAAEVGVSPALVVGVLQHEGKLSRRNLNRLKESVSEKIPRKYWAEKYLTKLRHG